jgi:hypothetical protein
MKTVLLHIVYLCSMAITITSIYTSHGLLAIWLGIFTMFVAYLLVRDGYDA